MKASAGMNELTYKAFEIIRIMDEGELEPAIIYALERLAEKNPIKALGLLEMWKSAFLTPRNLLADAEIGNLRKLIKDFKR